MARRGAFDYILLETTGLADPGNIAPLFWVDEGLGSTIYLDGIVTLVDAANILRSLDEPLADEAVVHDHGHEHEHAGPQLSTAHLQISHADVVIVNKTDLVSTQALVAVQDRVRAINRMAKMHATQRSQVPRLEGLVLDLHAYDDVDAGSLEFASRGHSHLDPVIGTMSLDVKVLDGERGLSSLDAWLRSVLWESVLPGMEGEKTTGWEIHRIKGRLVLWDGKVKMLQGVREIFELIDAAAVAGQHDEMGKIVIIGRNIGGEASKTAFQQSLDAAVAGHPLR